jgi:tellurite resistance protein
MPTHRRIPTNVFGAPFGLAGLAGAWAYAGSTGLAPRAIGQLLAAVAAIAWLAALVVYGRDVLRARRLVADLTDVIFGPFLALAVIVPMPLTVYGLEPHAHGAAQVIVDVFLVLTGVLGGWYTGQWMTGGLDIDKLHPGYFLPTVAGGLVASASAAAVGQHRLAELMFGYGVICWFVLGSILIARLFFRAQLPLPLRPTMAIEVAPPVVASLAYFTLNGGELDTVALGLAGYGALMAIAQLRLIPLYLEVPFGPGSWAYTFAYAAVATVGLHWLHDRDVFSWLVLAAITLFIARIAGRALLRIAQGTYLPAPPPQPPAPPAASAVPAAAPTTPR